MESSHRWAFVRMVLGVLQMTGAIFSIGLMIHSGLNALSLTLVVITSFLTTVSVVLFGSRSESRKGREARRTYRATPPGRKVLEAAKMKVQELFGELLED